MSKKITKMLDACENVCAKMYEYVCMNMYVRMCARKCMTGLFLYTKLGPVSGTKFFPNWLKKFPIDLEHSQLAEKVNYPNFAKNCTIFSQNCCIFSQNHTTLPQFHWYLKFPKKVRKSPV